MASSNPKSIDDLIVCLMSMGFELGDCQDAVSAGKLSVEAALEWILQGKPGKVATQPTASLKLQKNPGNLTPSSNPFVNPVAPSDSSSGSHDNLSQSHDRGSESCDSAAGSHDKTPANQESEMESETKIVSRLSLSEDQRKIKEQFLEKQREAAKKLAKDQKAQDKRARAEALKRIAEDREKKKALQGAHLDAPSPPKQSSRSPPVTAPTKPSQEGDKCVIQVRLPDGRAVKETFSPNDKLKAVWDFVATKHRNMSSMCLIQPFPRYEFSVSDIQKSLSELRLIPSGSLVLKKTEQPQAVAASVGEPTGSDADEDEFPLGGGAGNQHDWGQGHMLSAEEDNAALPGEVNAHVDAAEHGSAGAGVDFAGAFDPDVNPNINPILAGMQLPGMPGMMGGIGGGGGGGFGAGGGHQWGEGMQLAREDAHAEFTHHSQSASERAAEAARQRFAHPAETPLNEQPSTASTAVLMHDVPSLAHLCICHVTSRICDPRTPILSLGGVPEEVTQKILSHLMKEKLLRFKTLQIFVSSHLRRLILDCYCYTTNELLNAVRYHTNLVHLSLRDCPLITDSGLQHISGLQRLKVLNLSYCRLLTNKCLSTVAELPALTTLALEGICVSDAGLQQYTASKPPSLLHLNLNRTAVTQSVFTALQEIPQLKTLLLEQTKIQSLTGIQTLSQLETLNLAGTEVVTESLLCLKELNCLTSLNISNTENVVGDQALQYLSGMRLQTLVLPSRLSTTNVGMQYLAGMPLTALDLTNYINVSDEGMSHIGKIQSLRSLILTNTKISDEGMLCLQGLVNLEVLHLDRTLISDVGAMLLKGFKKLTELSLASSGVSSKFLMEGALNSCVSLTKLNLSRTRVSNKGIRTLHLPSLTLLNLDSTWVKQDVTEQIPGCPCLQKVILHNLEHVREESEEDMEEDN
ncbi:uncharacterized protein LOC135478110 [Liolophura sinensis]|uniref:uncharacterized protein LOC135478110 n=1 Tax=Liolophura sinensis TaxID=3198878 RepID=UPI0031589B19